MIGLHELLSTYEQIKDLYPNAVALVEDGHGALVAFETAAVAVRAAWGLERDLPICLTSVGGRMVKMLRLPVPGVGDSTHGNQATIDSLTKAGHYVVVAEREWVITRHRKTGVSFPRVLSTISDQRV